MSLNKKNAEIFLCDFSDISGILKDFHYKKDSIGGGISWCFAMFLNGKLVGGSVLGKPRHEKKYGGAIDIRRMALVDESPKNSESWFLSQIIKFIASNTDYNNVLSYSDLTENHIGTIYKAANFKNIGLTSPTKYILWNNKRYHMRSVNIDRDYSYKLRKALQENDAKIITGKPKIIWIYEISKKLKRKKYKIKNLKHGINQMELF